MDTTQTITHLGLCAGYGGIELGLQRIFHALRTVALCEIEAFACANLVAKMEAGLLDPAPIWSDLKTFPWKMFRGKVDILTGGYPCQPFSAAGKRLGQNDPRHLWPFIADGIRILQPRVVYFENVDGHISLGLREVIEELGELGYKATWGIFSAREVGAPHQRKRVFILAHSNSGGIPRSISELGDLGQIRQRREDLAQDSDIAWPAGPSAGQYNWEPPRVVGYSNSTRSQEWAWQNTEELQRADPNGKTSATGPTKSSLGRNFDGPSDRMDDAKLFQSCDNRSDELRLLGNGVVPATAERAFLILAKQLDLI